MKLLCGLPFRDRLEIFNEFSNNNEVISSKSNWLRLIGKIFTCKTFTRNVGALNRSGADMNSQFSALIKMEDNNFKYYPKRR